MVSQLLRTRGVSRWVSQQQNRGLLGTAIEALAWNSASFPGDSSGSVGTIPAADRQLLTGWLAVRLPLILPETVSPGTEALFRGLVHAQGRDHPISHLGLELGWLGLLLSQSQISIRTDSLENYQVPFSHCPMASQSLDLPQGVVYGWRPSRAWYLLQGCRQALCTQE